MGGQGLDGGDKVLMGDPPSPPTRENPTVSALKWIRGKIYSANSQAQSFYLSNQKHLLSSFCKTTKLLLSHEKSFTKTGTKTNFVAAYRLYSLQ